MRCFNAGTDSHSGRSSPSPRAPRTTATVHEARLASTALTLVLIEREAAILPIAMSTQSPSFPATSFTFTQPQQSFRLLELPPELLELLSSDSPPTYVPNSYPYPRLIHNENSKLTTVHAGSTLSPHSPPPPLQARRHKRPTPDQLNTST